jgi:hypothetical protein
MLIIIRAKKRSQTVIVTVFKHLNWCNLESPGNNQIPAELILTGGKTIGY